MVDLFLGKVDDKTTCLFLLPTLNLSQPTYQAIQEAIYSREKFIDFGLSSTEATLLYEHNLACVAMSENLVRRNSPVIWTFVSICEYYVRELVLNGFLKLVSLRTHLMVADALTKSLLSLTFVGHRKSGPCRR